MATCKCEYCEGKGTVKLNGGIFELDCPVCKGKRKFEIEEGMKICPQCKGNSTIAQRVSWSVSIGAVCTCKKCGGKGVIPVES